MAKAWKQQFNCQSLQIYAILALPATVANYSYLHNSFFSPLSYTCDNYQHESFTFKNMFQRNAFIYFWDKIILPLLFELWWVLLLGCILWSWWWQSAAPREHNKTSKFPPFKKFYMKFHSNKMCTSVVHSTFRYTSNILP
jgi:hypothetical protein